MSHVALGQKKRIKLILEFWLLFRYLETNSTLTSQSDGDETCRKVQSALTPEISIDAEYFQRAASTTKKDVWIFDVNVPG